MSDIRMFLVTLMALAALAVGCTDTLNPGETSSMDVVQETEASDPLVNLIPCENHAECSPSYCVAGYCNGEIDPKDPVITDDVVEDKTSCDSSETDSAEEITEEIVEPKCASNADCDEKDACYEGVCNWGVCIYTLVVDCPGECSDGACQNLCEVDTDCVHSDDPCENTTCDFNNKLGVKVCNDWYVGEAKFCDLPNGEQGKCYNFECVEYECSSSDHCDDGDPCTQNLCTAGQCVYAPQACECQNGYDCNDYNSCTDDICLMGNCQNPAIPGAVGIACGDLSICQPDGSCQVVECINDSDCDDSNPCTDGGFKQPDQCENNECINIPTPNYGLCGPDGSGLYCFEGDCTFFDCDDDDDCTVDFIDSGTGECAHSPLEACYELCGSDEDCNDGNDCTIDSCNAGACNYEDECFYGDFGFKSLMCDSDEDCFGSEFGDYCVESELNGEEFDIVSLSLCQPCTEYGVDMGCEEGSICTWGASSSQVGLYVSVFQCEDIVCESSEDCDDGDPCTKDQCHITSCSSYDKDLCFYCDSDSDCESNSWCENSSGGVHVEYPVCEADGTCQVDYWVTMEESLYGCNNPLECSSDADCPMSGVCMISTCVYLSVADDFVYPECNGDSQCELGDCNFETGTCVEWECYGIDNGDGTLSVKLCPIGFGCVDNACTDELVATTCSTNMDCAVAGLGNFCLDHMVTGENTCYQCNPESDTGEGFDHGCTSAQPFCGWVDDEVGYECLQCYSDVSCDDGQVCYDNQCVAPLEEGACNTDDDCGPWQECYEGFCEGYGPVHCQFECPDGDFDWQNVNIFHGDDEMTTIACGEIWVVTTSNLCLWGEEYPTFSVNLDDGVWEWGGGLDTTITCNYPTQEVPDPTPTDTPGVTKGDLGVNLVTVVTNNTCAVSD